MKYLKIIISLHSQPLGALRPERGGHATDTGVEYPHATKTAKPQAAPYALFLLGFFVVREPLFAFSDFFSASIRLIVRGIGSSW